jgi:hypothetical protein
VDRSTHRTEELAPAGDLAEPLTRMRPYLRLRAVARTAKAKPQTFLRHGHCR